MNYLTPTEILAIHAKIIDATSGRHGIRDLGLLISITEKPKAAFGGKEMYANVFEKAAVYFDALVHYHVFIDGNKRTAIATAARFLFINGYELHASNKILENFVLQVVLKKISVKEITDWLSVNCKKLN